MISNIAEHNRKAWNHEAELKNEWTVPVSREVIKEARNGVWQLLLTPAKFVPSEWFPQDIRGVKVLCLASGGGQQGPVLAAAGAIVTVLDNSENQLAADRMVAEREGLNITTVQGDMRDLSCFKDESFDLIFHPVSNCFADNIQPVWNGAFRVLKKGGRMLAGFNNPILYAFNPELRDKGILQVKYSIPYSDAEHLEKDKLEKMIAECQPIEFSHSLEAQIGGICKAGFVISGFYEDTGNGKYLEDKFMSIFIAVSAVKL